jgi:formylmethanofuran dehydrogenase subunit E
MSDDDNAFEKARKFHGHACPGIVLGTRLTLAGLRELDMNPHEDNRNLIVYLEIDRCGADAVQAITGCSLGHRSLKHRDLGKFAATFVDLASGRAVRVAVVEKNRADHDRLDPKAVLAVLAGCPEEEILKIERVSIHVPENDLPGYPKGSAICHSCGERIMDNRQVVVDGKSMCRNCAGESYYSELPP